MATPLLSRRELLKLTAAGVTTCSVSGWLEAFANDNANNPRRRRSCILLWMNGGPSQIDTFDLKPGHANGGPFRETQTNVEGIRISEHLPRVARHMDKMAIIRSMSSREGDHGRGTFLMHTGYLPQGPIQYPTMGSFLSKEIGDPQAPLPNFVSIAPYRLFSPASYAPGYLGPTYAPLLVGDITNFNARPGQRDGYDDSTLRVSDMAPPPGIERPQADNRIGVLEEMERDFAARHPGAAPASHMTAYNRAVRLMRTNARTAFNLEEEPARVRDTYGRNLFGQGCLLARRLVERGVAFVEVTLGSFNGNALGWDTHGQNFDNVRRLSALLDPGWAALMEDLQQRGLLESTLIVWMGEFGRTPRINQQQGRDHYPNAWSTVLAGGGVRGGQVFGATTADGMNVDSGVGRTVSVPDFMATICRSLGLDPGSSNMSNVGRPIRLADHGARAVTELVRA